MAHRSRNCPSVKAGRCTAQGHRAMVHTCTHYPGHEARHKCGCELTWPNTPTTKNPSARRRGWSSES